MRHLVSFCLASFRANWRHRLFMCAAGSILSFLCAMSHSISPLAPCGVYYLGLISNGELFLVCLNDIWSLCSILNSMQRYHALTFFSHQAARIFPDRHLMVTDLKLQQYAYGFEEATVIARLHVLRRLMGGSTSVAPTLSRMFACREQAMLSCCIVVSPLEASLCCKHKYRSRAASKNSSDSLSPPFPLVSFRVLRCLLSCNVICQVSLVTHPRSCCLGQSDCCARQPHPCAIRKESQCYEPRAGSAGRPGPRGCSPYSRPGSRLWQAGQGCRDQRRCPEPGCHLRCISWCGIASDSVCVFDRPQIRYDLITSFCLDSLLIDTGSSNTWVGAGKKYVKTSTSVQTKDSVVRI